MAYLKKFTAYLRSWDIFGHKVSVHHKGETSYKTSLGFVVSTVVFGLIIANLINLTTAFMDDSRLEEKSNFQVYDRHESPSFNLTENGIRMVFYMYVEDETYEENSDIATVTF